MFVLGNIVCATIGCEPNAVIAKWHCPERTQSGLLGSGGKTAGTDASDDSFVFPWATGYENEWCDYREDGYGFCFATGDGSRYEIVTSPVRSGSYAAAFTVRGDMDSAVGANRQGGQSRCFREGNLPTEGYYGAWYYVPELSRSHGNWNLIHFQGRNTPDEDLWNLWDVSFVNKDNGDLRMSVWNSLGSVLPKQDNLPSVPIANWFHIEVYLKRAADKTGEFALYQDGAVILEAHDIVTDNSLWGQWYVGNLAQSLEPIDSTLYVDDVTLSAAP
jgi:hypothetical protein